MNWDEEKAIEVSLIGGAVLGAIVGGIVGFHVAGVGGAMLGLIIGIIPGTILGTTTYLFLVILPDLLQAVIVILFWALIIWLICRLWGVGN